MTRKPSRAPDAPADETPYERDQRLQQQPRRRGRPPRAQAAEAHTEDAVKKSPGRKPGSIATEAGEKLDVGRFLSSSAKWTGFGFWIVGTMPLLCHAWSEKARMSMLAAQTKAIRAAREKRDPLEEFRASLYDLGEGRYGFPAMGIKKCLLSAAHKSRGLPRDACMRGIDIHAPLVRVRPALAGAVCNLPLLEVFGSEPEMREDMVRIGVGLSKTANLAYRGQFDSWAIKVVGRYNASVLNEDVLTTLVNDSGQSCGIGEWRNEKNGPFGTFRMASSEEEAAWEKFARGKGPLPQRRDPDYFAMAAE